MMIDLSLYFCLPWSPGPGLRRRWCRRRRRWRRCPRCRRRETRSWTRRRPRQRRRRQWATSLVRPLLRCCIRRYSRCWIFGPCIGFGPKMSIFLCIYYDSIMSIGKTLFCRGRGRMFMPAFILHRKQMCEHHWTSFYSLHVEKVSN